MILNNYIYIYIYFYYYIFTNEHREYSCKEYCRDNCTNEICHALECDSCK